MSASLSYSSYTLLLVVLKEADDRTRREIAAVAAVPGATVGVGLEAPIIRNPSVPLHVIAGIVAGRLDIAPGVTSQVLDLALELAHVKPPCFLACRPTDLSG